MVIGANAGAAATTNTSAQGLTTVGYDSFAVATTPAGSTGLGFRAGWKTTTGQNNTFIGNMAGSEVTTGSNNTIVGKFIGAAPLEATCVLSDGLGAAKLFINDVGAVSFSSTTAFGNVGQLLMSNGNGAPPQWTTIPSSTPTSPGVLYGFTGEGTTNKNTFLGAGAGTNVTTGTNNLILGANAASGLTTGSNNVVIGKATMSSGDDGVVAISTMTGLTRLYFTSTGAMAIGGNVLYGNSGDILVSRGSSSAPQWTSGQDLTGWRTSTVTNSSIGTMLINFTNNGPKSIIVNATAACKATNSSQVLNIGVVYDGVNAPTVQNMSTPIVVGSNVISITFTPASQGVLTMAINNVTSGSQNISYRVAYNVSESWQ